MARFILRVDELEKKVNNTAPPSTNVQDTPVENVPANAGQNISQERSKIPTTVSLSHSEISAKAAQALESKHSPSQDPSKEASKTRNVSDDQVHAMPAANTLTVVDEEGLDEHDDVADAFETEVLSEDNVNASLGNSAAKTAVVKLAHRTVPAVSSSGEGKAAANSSSVPPRARSAKIIVPAASTEPFKVDSVPPPPPSPPASVDIKEVHATATDEDSVLGAPPVPPSVAKVPPPPSTTKVEDADTEADSESDTADADDTEDATVSETDEAAEDELKKDDEALASDTSAAANADEEVASEEKELDTEEAAVGEDERSSEMDDEAV
jgi:hypothetical protein